MESQITFERNVLKSVREKMGRKYFERNKCYKLKDEKLTTNRISYSTFWVILVMACVDMILVINYTPRIDTTRG